MRLTDDMLDLFEFMGHMSMATDHYLSGKPAGLTLGETARTRTAIQNQLLFLPFAAETDAGSPYNLYGPCRLTALISSVAVILPMPSTYDVCKVLPSDLKRRLKLRDGHTILRIVPIQLWILILGGVVALD